MTDRIWEGLLLEQDKQVITKADYDKEDASSWEPRSVDENPMVLVINMQQLIVGENVPILNAVEEYRITMSDIARDVIEHVDPSLDFTREQGLPATYTRVAPLSYDDLDHPDPDIVDPAASEEDDAVVDKSYVLAPYGTDLFSWLVRGGHDLVIIVGSSTSGCVRATVVDAKQNGFSIIPPQECILDRIEAPYKTGLLDLWVKYAEVFETGAVGEWVETL